MKLGSTPEVIVHGKTGFLCESVAECIAAIEQARELDRSACRQHAVDRFSVQTMVDGYEAVYQQILKERFSQNGHAHHFRELELHSR